jgi:hypothetical protein
MIGFFLMDFALCGMLFFGFVKGMNGIYHNNGAD